MTRRSLIVVGVLAFALRAWPRPVFYLHRDQAFVPDMAMAALLEGHWRPTSYAYPSGEMYLLRVAYTIAYAAGNAVGAWAELYATHLAQPFPFLLVARGWSVLTGTATVLAIALLAQRAFGAPHGLLAGLLLACSFGHVRLRPGAEQLALFEPIDASAFPLRGFDAVEAPGPTITIWRLR